MDYLILVIHNQVMMGGVWEDVGQFFCRFWHPDLQLASHEFIPMFIYNYVN